MFIVILNFYHLGGTLDHKIIGTYGTLTTPKIDNDVKKFINENLLVDDNIMSDYIYEIVGHYLPIKKLVDVEKSTYLSLPKLNEASSDDDDDDDDDD